MNQVARALQQVVLFVMEFLPEQVRPFLQTVADLLGRLSPDVGDERMAKVAQLVAELLVDLRILGDIHDADVAMRLRLIAENRFTRAWRDLGLEGV